jgi:hypothetical protein
MSNISCTFKQHDDDRGNDFTCPENNKSVRWKIIFSTNNSQLQEDYEDESVRAIVSLHFNAYGDNADTEEGAKASMLHALQCYQIAHTAYVSYARAFQEEHGACTMCTPLPIENFTENDRIEVNNEMLTPFIQHFTRGQRTTFALSELDTIDQYRFILYGTMNFISALFGSRHGFYELGDANGETTHDLHGEYNVFEDYEALITWLKKN